MFLLGIPMLGLCAQQTAPDYATVPSDSLLQQSQGPSAASLMSASEAEYLVTAGDGPAFTLEFADIRDRTGKGFDDPLLGHERRKIAVSVFERVSKILDGEPGTARIRLGSSSPWLNENTLAIGIPLFQCIDGFQKPIIHNALRNDIHVHDYEGELLVNFELPLSASFKTPPVGEYDLYTVLFHEMVHILGFVGFTVEADGRPQDCGGARMLPALAGFTTDSQGRKLWTDQGGEITYLGNPADLPSTLEPVMLDIPQAGDYALRLATGTLRVSGHWLPGDFSRRDGVLMLREPFPSGQVRRNLTPETKAILESVLEYRVSQDPRGLSGAWVDAGLNGQGFTLHFTAQDQFVIYFYGFADNGDRIWMLGVHEGTFLLGDTITVPLVEASGGQFNHFNIADISESPWGELEIRFQDCLNAEVTLSGLDGAQSMQLFPLARIDGLDCY
jgi:hypothetical protein